MSSLVGKIKDIEDEMARTQINKQTMAHICGLRAKLARYKRELLFDAPKSGAQGTGEGFDVKATGDARVGLVGFPSVGKSTLLTSLTGIFSEAASYEFTTLTCIPGVIHHKGAKIQLLDLPGIIEGAKDGKGRGRQVISGPLTPPNPSPKPGPNPSPSLNPNPNPTPEPNPDSNPTLTLLTLAGHLYGAHVPLYHHRPRRDEAARPQADHRARAGGGGHPTQQEAARHRRHEEAQGGPQLLDFGQGY